MDFEQREVHLRTGTCPSCSKEFAFVEGATVSRLAPVGSPDSGDSDEATAAATVTAGGPECETCGAPLAFREGTGGSLEVVCADCETTTVFVPQRAPGRPERIRERAPRFDDAGPPRGRPCRKCGAPLRFSTGEDGNLVGECDSCGNRFTLPPREGNGGDRPRGRGGPPRYGRRDFRPSSGGRPPYRGRGGDREGRPFRRTDRGASPRFDDDDARRKRRRRDD
jgi:uncharacterized Zn finger protein (UPF0148 family)